MRVDLIIKTSKLGKKTEKRFTVFEKNEVEELLLDTGILGKILRDEEVTIKPYFQEKRK